MQFIALDPGRPQPISRDERTQLRAALMTAEEDMKAAQTRAALLYSENQTLREEARRQKGRILEVEKQLGERKADIVRLTDERDAARADAGEAQQEVAELQAMLPRTDVPPPLGESRVGA
jgi:chromosome segregation ATPase